MNTSSEKERKLFWLSQISWERHMVSGISPKILHGWIYDCRELEHEILEIDQFNASVLGNG